MGQTVNLLAYAFGGSNPSLPTKNCGSSSVDRALAFQAEGRGFEPRLPLFKGYQLVSFFLFSLMNGFRLNASFFGKCFLFFYWF